MDARTGGHAVQINGDEHQVSFDELFTRLKSSDAGLSQDEALNRLTEYGANVLEDTGKESLLYKYLKQFWNFFSILLRSPALSAKYPVKCSLSNRGFLYLYLMNRPISPAG